MQRSLVSKFCLAPPGQTGCHGAIQKLIGLGKTFLLKLILKIVGLIVVMVRSEYNKRFPDKSHAIKSYAIVLKT